MSLSNARFSLRDATAPLHERVDQAFAAFDLSDAGDYARFLAAHARALPPLERLVTAEGGWGGWAPRAEALMADLADIGLKPPAPLPVEIGPDPAHLWAVQYVLEGAKLGGQVLAQRVPDGFPRRYLAAPFQPELWRRFQTELNSAASAGDEGWLDAAIVGARVAFDLFETAARVESGT